MLVLTGVAELGRRIQQLISCTRVTELFVLYKSLRRLTVRCCHQLACMIVDASELRTFEYRGFVPTQPSLLTMHHAWAHGPRSLSSCRVDLCGGELMSEEEFLDTHHLKYNRDTTIMEKLPVDVLVPYLREMNMVKLIGRWHAA
ncbi:hypothetical protein D1007_57775 [Hordeum vulgare]|nr:hypothetical protein D1007_57775 [Hordeum vulgare]KAI4984288.1 hypothetical protein ZWY2020_054569 [Hordeum vulgare]